MTQVSLPSAGLGLKWDFRTWTDDSTYYRSRHVTVQFWRHGFLYISKLRGYYLLLFYFSPYYTHYNLLFHIIFSIISIISLTYFGLLFPIISNSRFGLLFLLFQLYYFNYFYRYILYSLLLLKLYYFSYIYWKVLYQLLLFVCIIWIIHIKRIIAIKTLLFSLFI